MVHPAQFRIPAIHGHAGGLSQPADRARRAVEGTAQGLLRRLTLWWKAGYRPERHYMRGGRTAGAKSLAVG